MYGRRRYYKRRNYPIARPFKKYSAENIVHGGTFNSSGGGWEYPTYESAPLGYYIVNPAQFNIDSVTRTLAGTRKAKNFTITMVCDQDVPVMWAIVYKPEGVDVKGLNATGTGNSIYEPNQNVVATGVYTKGQQNRWTSRMARNLSSGDSIVLLLSFYTNESLAIDWTAQISYAISF